MKRAKCIIACSYLAKKKRYQGAEHDPSYNAPLVSALCDRSTRASSRWAESRGIPFFPIVRIHRLPSRKRLRWVGDLGRATRRICVIGAGGGGRRDAGSGGGGALQGQRSLYLQGADPAAADRRCRDQPEPRPPPAQALPGAGTGAVGAHPLAAGDHAGAGASVAAGRARHRAQHRRDVECGATARPVV